MSVGVFSFRHLFSFTRERSYMNIKEKGILFNRDMVQAILDGRKTQTRRIIMPQPKMRLCYVSGGSGVSKWSYPSKDAWKYWGSEYQYPEDLTLTKEDEKQLWTPPCHTDDILYVRETFALHGRGSEKSMHYDYRADREDPQYFDDGFMASWTPAIHMPRKAARIWLKVDHVSVQRIQSATEEELLKEGIYQIPKEYPYAGQWTSKRHPSKENVFNSPQECFKAVWDCTLHNRHEEEACLFERNPYVFVVSFHRTENTLS